MQIIPDDSSMRAVRASMLRVGIDLVHSRIKFGTGQPASFQLGNCFVHNLEGSLAVCTEGTRGEVGQMPQRRALSCPLRNISGSRTARALTFGGYPDGCGGSCAPLHEHRPQSVGFGHAQRCAP